MGGDDKDTRTVLGYYARGHHPLNYTIMQKMAAGRDGRRAMPRPVTFRDSIRFGEGACAVRRNGRLDLLHLGIAFFKLGIFDTDAIPFSPSHSWKLNGLWAFQLETRLL